MISKTSEYYSWQAMKMRCYYKKHRNYKNYGGRGIVVCDRWLHNFRAFLGDMGYKPTPKHTIDRIDTDGNYEPSNCKWSTQKEQQSNRRNSHRLCSVLICGRKHYARDYCKLHYKRLFRTRVNGKESYAASNTIH